MVDWRQVRDEDGLRPPTLADRPPTLASHPPTLADRSPALASRSPTLADRPPTLADRSPALADRSPTLADRSPTLADHSPALADRSPTLADRSPALIGGYENLGWRLGAYDRGERICRAFAAGQPPQVAPLPSGLSEKDQAVFLGEWAVYLKDLGQLNAALRCYECALDMAISMEKWDNASAENQNLAEVFLASGRLQSGLSAAEESLRFAHRSNDPLRKWYSYAIRARIRAYLGQASGALSDFNESHQWQRQVDRKLERPLFAVPGVQRALLTARLGRIGEAVQLAEANQPICAELYGSDNLVEPNIKLLLAELTCQQGNLAASRELLHEAHRWALRRDAKELLCWAALVRAKMELSAFDGKDFLDQAVQTNLTRAASALQDGLRIASDCGFGILYIDLLLTRAQLSLHEGRATDAERDVRAALGEGLRSPTEPAFPKFLAATDPECLYVWGIAEGRRLLAESLLLQAAQKLGQAEVKLEHLEDLPIINNLVNQAREQLTDALKLWRDLKDPESSANINPRSDQILLVIKQLDQKVLTAYPLELPKQESLSQESPRSATADQLSSSVSAQSTVLQPASTGALAKSSLISQKIRSNDVLSRAGRLTSEDQDLLNKIILAAQEAQIQQLFIATSQEDLFTKEGFGAARFLAVSGVVPRGKARLLQTLVKSDAYVFFANPEQAEAHWFVEFSHIIQEGGSVVEVIL